MNRLPKYLFVCFLALLSFNAIAQTKYPITGTIVDDNGAPVKGATVFISGTEKITSTNNEGKFELDAEAGSFQLSAMMMGFATETRNIMILSGPAKVDLGLHVKSITLAEVTIGSESNWEAYFKIFKGQFLGTTLNAEQCTILNPKVLSFNYDKKKGLLTAEANEFMEIENKRLGYKIKYLLRDFQFSAVTNTAIYDGDSNFQQMDGTPRMQKQWEKNRADTYKGSMMHYLRSVYKNTTLKEGFITNAMYGTFYKTDDEDVPMITIDPHEMQYDTVVNKIDTSFIALKSSQLYITYDPKKAQLIRSNAEVPEKKELELNNPKGSFIKLPFKEAIIDRRGSYTNYKAFLLHGNLAAKRVGDQLPFEYQPPKE